MNEKILYENVFILCFHLIINMPKFVIKRDGRKEEFIPEKIVVAAVKSGAPVDKAREIAEKVKKIEKKDVENLKQLLNPEIVPKTDNLKEISLGINSPINILGYECNNIESVKRGVLKRLPKDKKGKISGSKKEEGIIIQRDINRKC